MYSRENEWFQRRRDRFIITYIHCANVCSPSSGSYLDNTSINVFFFKLEYLEKDLILSRLERRKKGVYGPPAGRRCLTFVDDLNMPAKETYGAQPSLELLRQYFDYHQW